MQVLKERKLKRYEKGLFIILDVADAAHIEVVKTEKGETLWFYLLEKAEQFALENLESGWQVVKVESFEGDR